MIPDQARTDPNDPPWIHPRAAYVHIPFCAHKCGYCDFAIATGQDQRIDDYLAALSREIALLGGVAPVRTLFVGGGTPSHLNVDQLAKLCSILQAGLPAIKGGEVSLEANPESLTREKVKILADAGFTRISLGAQSFSRETLRSLDRPHDPDAVRDSVTLVKESGLVVSLDMIFGAPDQSISQWQTDLGEAIRLGTDHISTYGLTYEKGTPLDKRVRLGMVRPVGEDIERAMYAEAIAELGAAGYEHYEISNFAKANRRCAHNEVYWANEAHHGFGMGAAGYVGLSRNLNTRDLERYIRLCLEGVRPVFQSETLKPRERAGETMAQNLRRIEGVETDRFLEQTGFDPQTFFAPELERLVEQGFLESNPKRFRLTHEGKFVADSVIERLMRCV